jgi:hypothetical protein
VQAVSIDGVANAGTFRLAFDGATTSVIPWDASADQVAHALNSLQTVGAVAVSSSSSSGSWTVTFLDNVGDQSLLEATSVMLRGPAAVR